MAVVSADEPKIRLEEMTYVPCDFANLLVMSMSGCITEYQSIYVGSNFSDSYSSLGMEII